MGKACGAPSKGNKIDRSGSCTLADPSSRREAGHADPDSGGTGVACRGAVSLTARAADPDPAELAKKAEQVLKTNCHRCHGQDGANEGGFNYVLDRQQLVNRKKVFPGEPAKSRLYLRVSSADDPMPPDAETPRPSKDDIALLKP